MIYKPYTKWSISLLINLLMLCAAYAASSTDNPDTPLIREDDTVAINGGNEHWKLVWKSKPSPICIPEQGKNSGWDTCPCNGFAFGEAGLLDLVRTRSGVPDEIFPLTPLFENQDVPAKSGAATLQKWEATLTDRNKWGEKGPSNFNKLMQTRELAKIIQLGDYDHDGAASEFLLQIGTAGCGHTQNVIVGISPTNPKLHVFGTAEHPKSPLILDDFVWDKLLNSSGNITITDRPCGDHGSDEQEELVLRIDAQGIHAKKVVYQCADNTFEKTDTIVSTEIL